MPDKEGTNAPGMMTEAQQQSSGSVPQTPPIAGPGNTEPGGGGPESGQPPQNFEELRDQATQLVYGERFDQLIEMFKSNGPEKFARSMAITINTAIDEIEKKNGKIDFEMAAQIGSDLMLKLLEDMLTKPNEGVGAVVEGVTIEQMQEVLPAVLVMFSDSRPDVSKEDVQGVFREVEVGVQQQGGSPPPGSGGMPQGNAPAPPEPGGTGHIQQGGA